MYKVLWATVLSVALSSLPTRSATAEVVSPADFADLQAQVRTLAQRVDELAASNSSLQAENVELRAGLARVGASSAPVTATASAPPAMSGKPTEATVTTQPTDWTSRLKWRGDFRYRHEHQTFERDVSGVAVDAADRDRQRVRARFGLEAAVTDSVKVAAQLASGGDDPRSSNQTLGSAGTRKAIGLDLAYADWSVQPGVNLVLGKQPYPVWRPAHSLFLDSDFNPEGVALRWSRGAGFANLYGHWLSEQFNAEPSAENSDANIVGIQGGLKLPAFGGETILAANYYVCGACRDNSPLYNNNGNGNTTYLAGTTNVLQYDYEILDLNAQVGLDLAGRPLALTAGYARNLASDVVHDTAWSLGAVLGKASDAGSWEVGALYQSIDKDALFGQIFESDFGDGRTDSVGWMLKGGYAPTKNVTLNTTYYLYTVNKDVGTELDLTRLQLDLNYKF